MCGFAGVFNLNGLAGDKEERLARLGAMSAQLARRGPDDEQFYDDGMLSFVFRRLSIVDVEGGRQPIWNEDRSVFAAVNGEIYNHMDLRAKLGDAHAFGSQSDSEVVVHLYEDHGPALLDELNGMFAIVVWDTEKRQLLLARDRLGIKPLYYAEVDGTLLFASEMKALLTHPLCPRELDWAAFDYRWDGRDVPPTYIQGVDQLLGGHWMRAGAGGSTGPRCYWSVRDFCPPPDARAEQSAEAYVDQYGELLDDAVRMRLMSDVPVGLFLSGGIDSTLVAALMGEAQPGMHCFTVVEDTTVQVGDVEEARRAVEELDLVYHPVRFNEKTLVDELDYGLSDFEFLVWAVERPNFNVEWFFKHELHRYAKTAVPGLKVIQLGQGADEFAGGYSRSVGYDPGGWDNYLQALRLAERKERYLRRGVPLGLQHLLAPGYPPPPADETLSRYHRQMLNRAISLQHYNLWHEDRTSAAQSNESRVPFLDHRLVELLASVPVDLHDDLFYGKRIVREQLYRALPTYPKDKLKVRFYRTGREVSIWYMLIRVLNRIFPAFRDKYLDRADAVFSIRELSGIQQRIASGAQFEPRMLEGLFKVMGITAFAHMLKSLATDGPPKAVNPPSPLRTEHVTVG